MASPLETSALSVAADSESRSALQREGAAVYVPRETERNPKGPKDPIIRYLGLG